MIKRLEDLEIRSQVEIIQTTALLRLPEYWKELWRLEKTCCLSSSNEKPSANAAVKNSKGRKIIITMVIIINCNKPDRMVKYYKKINVTFNLYGRCQKIKKKTISVI